MADYHAVYAKSNYIILIIIYMKSKLSVWMPKVSAQSRLVVGFADIIMML